MMESTSSWTNASGSNPNLFIANGTIADRNGAPGMSACLASQASKRFAMPCGCGIPPIPAGCSITRLLSVIANWPSRKKPSRGVVAIQLGFPRPAFRNADCVVREVCLASLISSSLISNGPNVSNLRSFTRSMIFTFQKTLRQEHDEHHAPDCKKSVTDGISNGIPQCWYLALAQIADQAKRSRRRACPGNDAKYKRIVEAEQVFAEEHPEEKGNRRCQGPPKEQANALGPQSVHEARARGDSDYGNEDVEANGVHEPNRRCRDAAELGMHRAQPSANQSR